MRLLSVRFYLGEDALLGNGIDDFLRYFRISCVQGEGNDLCVVRRTVVIGLACLFLSLRTVQYPSQQLAEPCFQLLGIFRGEGL